MAAEEDNRKMQVLRENLKRYYAYSYHAQYARNMIEYLESKQTGLKSPQLFGVRSESFAESRTIQIMTVSDLKAAYEKQAEANESKTKAIDEIMSKFSSSVRMILQTGYITANIKNLGPQFNSKMSKIAEKMGIQRLALYRRVWAEAYEVVTDEDVDRLEKLDEQIKESNFSVQYQLNIYNKTKLEKASI